MAAISRENYYICCCVFGGVLYADGPVLLIIVLFFRCCFTTPGAIDRRRTNFSQQNQPQPKTMDWEWVSSGAKTDPSQPTTSWIGAIWNHPRVQNFSPKNWTTLLPLWGHSTPITVLMEPLSYHNNPLRSQSLTITLHWHHSSPLWPKTKLRRLSWVQLSSQIFLFFASQHHQNICFFLKTPITAYGHAIQPARGDWQRVRQP